MGVNWPPAAAPAWPPPEFGGRLESGDLDTLVQQLRELGYTDRAPTAAETRAFFRDARCDNGHAVVGRMVVHPTNGTTWPFALCNNAERRLLCLWAPYDVPTTTIGG